MKKFSINAPPFCTCAPPFEKKKKKRCLILPGYTPVATYPPPPPPDVDGAPKKKVSESPPRLSAFLGLARVSRLAAVRKKNSMLCPPFLKFLDPPLCLTLTVQCSLTFCQVQVMSFKYMYMRKRQITLWNYLYYYPPIILKITFISSQLQGHLREFQSPNKQEQMIVINW